MKHKRIYNILCKIEDLIVILLFIVGYIILISVPTSGDYTIGFILLKFGAMIGLVVLGKIEGYYSTENKQELLNKIKELLLLLIELNL